MSGERTATYTFRLSLFIREGTNLFAAKRASLVELMIRVARPCNMRRSEGRNRRRPRHAVVRGLRPLNQLLVSESPSVLDWQQSVSDDIFGHLLTLLPCSLVREPEMDAVVDTNAHHLCHHV